MGYKLHRRDGGERWHAYFVDRDGNRQRFSTRQTDKRRAGIVADEWYRRLADPSYSAANATTLQVASRHLIGALVRAKRSKATMGHFYPTKLGHLARVWGEDMPLARIDAKLVDGYIATREAEGAKAHTISKELTALRMLLRHARRRGEFDKELSQVMPIGYASGYKPRTRRLTMGEAHQLIGELPPNVRHYVAFVLCTTARDAAVGRARRRHFDAATGIEVYDLKTKGSSRTVPVVPFLADFAYLAFDATDPDAHIAPGLGSVRHALNRAAKRLGIPHLSPNDLRRSVAHWMLERGIPRDAAAAFMGHANTKMLDAVYGKLDPKELGATILRALAAGSSVDGSWKNGPSEGGLADAGDGVRAYLSCAGTESNRRHGDFQSTTTSQEQAGKQPFRVDGVDASWKEACPPGLPVTPAGLVALVVDMSTPWTDGFGEVHPPVLTPDDARAVLELPLLALGCLHGSGASLAEAERRLMVGS